MSRYIGNSAPYGIFEKQIITPLVATSEYSLLYRAASPNGLLVVRNNTIQEPGVDYSLTSGNLKILFAYVPLLSDNIYIIYLGRELSVPAVAGNQLQVHSFVGDGATTDFTLPIGPNYAASLLIFKDGVLQRYIEHWSLDVTGYIVQFVAAPANLTDIDCYVLGVARNDLSTVEDYTITTNKLQYGIQVGSLAHPAGPSVFNQLDVINDLDVGGVTTLNDLVVTGSVTGISGGDYSINNPFLQTTDGSFTGIINLPLADNTAVNFEVKIIGRRSGLVAHEVYWATYKGSIARYNGGAPVFIDETVLQDGRLNALTYSSRLIVFGNNLTVDVQGATGHSVNWSAHLKYIFIS